MGFGFEFKNFFGGSKETKPTTPAAEKPVNRLPETDIDREAAAFLAQLDKRGVSDRDVKIHSITGEATTEKAPVNTSRPSYLSDRKSA